MIEFECPVSEDGYQWIEADAYESVIPRDPKQYQHDWYLIEQKSCGARLYQPLHEATGLFRTFADVQPTREDILRFANTYGQLQVEPLWVRIPSEKSGQWTLHPGEPFKLWREAIQKMRRVVNVWDMAMAEDSQGLSQYIRWQDQKSVKYVDDSSGAIIAAPGYHPELLDRFCAGDVVQPAFYYVQCVINNQLEGHIAPRLLWGSARTRLGLYWCPSNLLGALWLQFARTIDGNKNHYPCDQCHTWFEVSPQVGRTDKRFCSDACRMIAYRTRQRQAQELAAQGISIVEIADALSTTQEKIQGWLAKTPPVTELQTARRRRGRPRKQLTINASSSQVAHEQGITGQSLADRTTLMDATTVDETIRSGQDIMS